MMWYRHRVSDNYRVQASDHSLEFQGSFMPSSDEEPLPSGSELVKTLRCGNVARLQAVWRGWLQRRQQRLACTCFCGRLRSYCQVESDGTAAHGYFVGLHKGLWRGYGKYVPHRPQHCCQSSPDVCDMRLTRMCVAQWLAHHPKPWSRCGRQRWVGVSHEFVPISEQRGAVFDELFALFNEYKAERAAGKVLSRKAFIDLYCKSPVGSMRTDVAAQLTSAGQLESKDGGSDTEWPAHAHLVGTCFSLMRWKGRVVGCMLLDVGPSFLATKIFWYDVADASRGDGAYGRSIIDLMWYKHLVLAGNLGHSHLWNGYSDPRLPRMCYKLERFFDHSEAQCEEGWLPLAQCMERDASGALRWSDQHTNPTKIAAHR